MNEDKEKIAWYRDRFMQHLDEIRKLEKRVRTLAADAEIARHREDITRQERVYDSKRNHEKVIRQSKAIVGLEKQVEELKKEKHELLGRIRQLESPRPSGTRRKSA